MVYLFNSLNANQELFNELAKQEAKSTHKFPLNYLHRNWPSWKKINMLKTSPEAGFFSPTISQ